MNISSSSDWFVVFAAATFVTWLMIIFQLKLDPGYGENSLSDRDDKEG